VQTIRRNATKKIAAIATATMATRLHELSSDFAAVPVPVEAAMTNLAAFDFAKLTDDGNGRYTVSVHSNKWYRLYTAEYFQNLGRAAYAKPNPIAAPAADAAMMKLMEGMPVGTGAKEMMLAWQTGWNAAADEAAAAILAEGV
jgi:hypothetical protein